MLSRDAKRLGRLLGCGRPALRFKVGKTSMKSPRLIAESVEVLFQCSGNGRDLLDRLPRLLGKIRKHLSCARKLVFKVFKSVLKIPRIRR